MKKKDVKVGGTYTAKVSGQLTNVLVTGIREGCGMKGNQTRYDVTNQRTGRRTTFASAQKFRCLARDLDKVAAKPRTAADVDSDQGRETEAAIGPPTYGERQQSLADRIRATKDTGVDDAPHLIIEARAGTGKTTTLIEGLKRVKGIESTLVPSPQQAAVWEAMELSKGRAQTICFVAFNKSIATELQSRVPEGCDAMTMHSMGFKAIRRAFNLTGGDRGTNQWRVQDIISELLGRDIRDLRRTKPGVVKATEELVGLCKMNLIHGLPELGCCVSIDALSDLASYYDVDLNGRQAEVFDLVPRVLERCKDVARDGCIDFNDMIWLPVALGLAVYRYDLLLVDEAQDLNRCQQALAKKAGRRLVLCGDPKQAIYGFAGADAESMARLERELSVTDRGCVHLPLTVTRRCGRAIVDEAKHIVPDFEAHESNTPGIVFFASLPRKDESDGNKMLPYHGMVQDGDMVLCRCNAPLVSECFRFLRAGRKANIQGRDVGAGLIRTVEKLMKGYVSPVESDLVKSLSITAEIIELHLRMDVWLHAEMAKENAKSTPSEQRVVNLQDKRDCITCFAEEAKTAADVVAKINSVFTDDKNGTGIRLSSVHKAKGLEARRVFILTPKEAPMPHPMARTAWEREQEMNIKYVAITRAIEELVWVS